MKYIIFIFLILIFCFSCDYSYLYFQFGEYDYNMSFNSIDEIFNWIKKNIKGQDNSLIIDINRVMTERKGDCKDQAYLMLDMAYKNFGKKGYMIMYITDYEKGNSHAVAAIDNIVYDPAWKKEKYNFSEFFALNFMRQETIYDFWRLQRYWFEIK